METITTHESIVPIMHHHVWQLKEIMHKTHFFTEPEVDCAVEMMYEALMQIDEYHIFIYEEYDIALGFICYGPASLADEVYDIYWIAVHPEKQKSGIGSKLLLFLESELKRKGARMILLETSSQPKYEPTRKFYEKKGYILENVLKDYYKPGDDRLIYVKRF